jgi:putative peptidoglycan lipid II flippase
LIKANSFLRIDSFRKGIVLSTILNLVSKGSLFAANLIVAFYFGSNDRTDIFFYVYNTTLLAAGFFSLLNAAVIIPESMRIREELTESKSFEFLNSFIVLYVAIIFSLSVFIYLLPVRAFEFISDFNTNILVENKTTLILAGPLFMLMVTTNFLTDTLISLRYFVMPMIIGTVNGLFCICFLVIFHSTLDVKSMLYGFLFGYSINIFLLLFIMKRELNWPLIKWPLFIIEKRIWINISYAQAGNITSVVSGYFPLFLLSGFGTGVITTLSLAQQIALIPSTLLINHFSTVAAIKFNELYAKKDLVALSQSFVTTANFLLFILIPISGVIFLFPDEIMGILYKHGNFGQRDSEASALFLKYLGLQLPALAINVLLSRIFSSTHKLSLAFWYQISFNVLLIIFIKANVTWLGIIGYPIALVTMHIANIAICYFLIKWSFNFLDYKSVLVKLTQLLVINALIVMFIKLTIASYGFFIGGTAYISIIITVNHFFKINEAAFGFVMIVFNKFKSSTNVGNNK